MWCILRCHSGCEKEMVESCRQHLSGQGFSDVFLFTYDRMKRYEGAWHLETGVMFPGCVFLEIEDESGRSIEEEARGLEQKCSRARWNRSNSSVCGCEDRTPRFDEDGTVDLCTQSVKDQSFNFNRYASDERQGDTLSTDLTLVPAEMESLLRRLCGKEHHLPMSVGYIRDGVTYVTSGPLVGMERSIRRIDRHKRMAKIALTAALDTGNVVAGLEIVSKS